MVRCNQPHLSPETATPPLREIIAQAVRVAEARHADAGFFSARNAHQSSSQEHQELYRIATDFHFLFDAHPEPIFDALQERFSQN